MANTQKPTIPHLGKDAGKQELSFFTGGNVTQYGHFRK